MSQRILLYSHDTVGLGHIQRISAIGRRLAAESPDSTILIITGSRVSGSLRLPDNVDIVKLPSWRKVDNARYEARHLRIGDEEILRLRSQLILNTFRHFAPDLFLIDKAPVGVHGELLETLEHCRASTPACRVVLSLRDILDTPEEVARHFEREGTFDALRRFYELVLVWGEERVFDVVREYDLPDDIAGMVQYCGYIAPPPDETEAPLPRKRKRIVLVTVGGGEDGRDLLESYLEALPQVRRRFASVVLTGPDMPDRERESLETKVDASDRPIFLIPYSRHVDRLLRAADLVVAMGGYNTLCEIVARGRPAIVVPRISPRQEQLIRARRWEELGLVSMIHPDELTPERLAKAIEDQLRRPKSPAAGTLDFEGLTRAAELLLAPSANAPAVGGVQ